MTVREYQRICKQAGCGQFFTVAAPSLEEDRQLGLSEPEYCPKHRILHAKSYSRIACHHYDVALTPEGESLVHRIEARKLAEAHEVADAQNVRFDPWTMPDTGYGPGGLGRFERPLRAFVADETFQPRHVDFQIKEKREELLGALEESQVVVLVGTTGSGKSTYVPWLLLTGGTPGALSKWARRGPICVTQPRIQATIQIPKFVANVLNGTALGAGSQIGFSTSKGDEYDRRTRLVFKTDGKLINDIVSGAVANYSIIMIDEAHERSVNIDLILGLLKRQLYLYPHLRLIIASATIDEETFISYYGGPDRVPYVFSQGRSYEITHRYWGEEDEADPASQWWTRLNGGSPPTRDQLPRTITELVASLCQEIDSSTGKERDRREGHVLVFLPGSGEINDTVAKINALDLPNVVALPLYAELPLDQQDMALSPDPVKHRDVASKRRVVVSTNVAETSLTVEGVKYVIDSGYVKTSYWNPIGETSELLVERHSQAGCQQRWGRAGRVGPGTAYMLYTRRQFLEGFPAHSSPAIARSSLEQVLLTAKAGGVPTASATTGQLQFDWMPLKQPADTQRLQEELKRAYRSLVQKGAIDSEGDLTPYGLELRGTPISPDVSRIFTECETFGMGVEAAAILPFLKLERGIRNLLLWNDDRDAYEKRAIRERHLDLVFGCQDDLDLYAKLWMLWEARTPEQRRIWAEESGISYADFEERIDEERRKILSTVMDERKSEHRDLAVEKLDALRALIAGAAPHEVYAPVEDVSSGRPQSRQPVLDWESFLDDIGDLGTWLEDDDALEGYELSGRSGLYRRLESADSPEDEADLIELVPTSVCFGQTDLTMFAACQRQTNFLRPARAKALGMNIVRLKPELLPAPGSSTLSRAIHYSALSRRDRQSRRRLLLYRLFLPWLAPRGSHVRAGEGSEPSPNGRELRWQVDLQGRVPLGTPPHGQATVSGRLRDERREPSNENGRNGTVSARVADYTIENGVPSVVLEQGRPIEQAFALFRRGIRPPQEIDVEMVRVLEDPLGRSPLFIVRETTSGIEIPMADTDFSSDGRPLPSMRRFPPGDRFSVTVENIVRETGRVHLSRGRQLLREYTSVRHDNRSVVDAEVLHADHHGAYLRIENSSYVTFVRRALWPPGFRGQIGEVVKGRMQRSARDLDPDEVAERLDRDGRLSADVDLGINLDLRVWHGYSVFTQEHGHGPGDLLPATVERPLENGGILVVLSQRLGLKGMVYETELEPNPATGTLKSARDYQPGSDIIVRVTGLQDATATVRVSAFRVQPCPDDLEAGDGIRVKVLHVGSDNRDRSVVRLTCCYRDVHQVQVKAARLTGTIYEPGMFLDVHVNKVRRNIVLIEADVASVPGDVS